MGLFDLFKKGSDDILAKRGDRMEARVTDTDRKVLKISKNNGKDKYSVTKYTNGTTVETKTTKKK